MFAVVAAMNIELNGFIKSLNITDRFHKDNFMVVRGSYKKKEYIVLRCGISARNVKRGLDFLFSRFPEIEGAVLIGVAGAINPASKPGDTFIPQIFTSDQGSRPYYVDYDYYNRLSTSNIKCYIGGKAISSNKLYRIQDKVDTFNSDHNTVFVDMEAFEFAKIMNDKKIPFLVIKSISDEISFRFPSDIRYIKEKYTLNDIRWLFRECFPFKVNDLVAVFQFKLRWKKAVQRNTKILKKFLKKRR